MTETQKVSLPLYEKLLTQDREQKIIEKFLTPSELVSQTDTFVNSFRVRIEQEKMPDTIFFLDKSSRPLAYIFGKLFHSYYPNSKIPQIRFINIGRQTSIELEHPFDGNPEIIAAVYGDHINTGGRILVVDDFTETGMTIQTATQSIQMAFPQATVEQQIAYTKNPAWHNTFYTGVVENTEYDFWGEAIIRLNKDLGTEYRALYQLIGQKHNGIDLFKRFCELNKEIGDEKSKKLYAKRRKDFRSSGVKEELDQLCDELLKTKSLSK